MEFLGDIDNPKETRAFAAKHLPKNQKKTREDLMAKNPFRKPLDNALDKTATDESNAVEMKGTYSMPMKMKKKHRMSGGEMNATHGAMALAKRQGY